MDTSLYVSTNYIKAKTGDRIVKSKPSMLYMYDSDKNKIANIASVSDYTIVEENVAYVRCNIPRSDLDAYMIVKNQDLPSSYVGFIPDSPSIAFPSKIRNCGDNINLLDFNITEQTTNGITTKNVENGITLEGTCTADTWIYFKFKNASLESGNYITTCKVNLQENDITNINDRISIKINGNDTLVNFNEKKIFVIKENDIMTEGYIRLWNGDKFNNTLIQCKLEKRNRGNRI